MTTVIGANVIDREGRILLVQEGKPGVAGQWNLPAGRLDEGETPMACARREAREEAGIDARPTTLVGIYCDRSPAVDGDVLVFAFHSQAGSDAPRVPSDDSVVDVAWVRPGDLDSRELREPYVARAVGDYAAGRGCDVERVVDLR